MRRSRLYGSGRSIYVFTIFDGADYRRVQCIKENLKYFCISHEIQSVFVRVQELNQRNVFAYRLYALQKCHSYIFDKLVIMYDMGKLWKVKRSSPLLIIAYSIKWGLCLRQCFNIIYKVYNNDLANSCSMPNSDLIWCKTIPLDFFEILCFFGIVSI